MKLLGLVTAAFIAFIGWIVYNSYTLLKEMDAL